MTTTETDGSWSHEEGAFIPQYTLPESFKLEAVGTYGPINEPAWRISRDDKTFILHTRPSAPDITMTGPSLCKCVRRKLSEHKEDAHLGEVVTRMCSGKVSTKEARDLLYSSGLARDVMTTNMGCLVKSAGSSLRDQWVGFTLHALASAAVEGLDARVEDRYPRISGWTKWVLHPYEREMENGDTPWASLVRTLATSAVDTLDWPLRELGLVDPDYHYAIQIIPDDGSFIPFGIGRNSADGDEAGLLGVWVVECEDC